MASEQDFQDIAQSIADGGKQVAVAKPEPKSLIPPSPVGDVLRYSPELFVDIVIRNPDFSHKDLGAVFGKSASWVAAVIASAAFQEALEPRRHEVLDPSISATLNERFQALTVRALVVLNEKLDAGKALPDLTVLKAVEVGVKALGMGQKAPEPQKSSEDAQNSSERVANKIMEAMARRAAAASSNSVDVEAREIPNE
jgi:hypothetical protein